MKTISFLNVKGGVGKTVSSVNVAYILADKYKKRVLLIDMDKQGNSSMALGVYDKAQMTVSDLLTDKNADIKQAIYKSEYNVDVIPANMSLIKANQDVLLDITTVQQTRLKKHVKKVEDQYDYCIIDCPTDLNMSTLNALTMTDDVMIPIKVDYYSLVGLTDVLETVDNMREFNENLQVKGCFLTMYQKTIINKQGFDYLKENIVPYGIRLFDTFIRNTSKVQESTFSKPIVAYDVSCTASQDYINLVKEYLEA